LKYVLNGKTTLKIYYQIVNQLTFLQYILNLKCFAKIRQEPYHVNFLLKYFRRDLTGKMPEWLLYDNPERGQNSKPANPKLVSIPICQLQSPASSCLDYYPTNPPTP